jgi:diadenylate cyclase
MGYLGYVHLEENKNPRGYRILNKIPRLPSIIIENLISNIGEHAKIISASVEDLYDVEGIW